LKGILIIGFNKSPGAYIETQYPPNIWSDLGLEPTDLMNIYALHRMRKMKPDYQKVKIKKIDLASFYTGFSVQRCIGYADKVVTIILSKEEELAKDYEDVLRRYAYEVLPSINDSLFGEAFITYYQKLKSGALRPYKKGMYDDETIELATVSSGTLSDQAIANVIESHSIDLGEIDFINQFKELEDEEDLHEIENLREFITEQELIMDTLAEEIVQHNIRQGALEQQVETLTEHYHNQNVRIEELVNTNVSLKEKISKLRVTSTKSVDSAHIIKELEEKNTELEEEISKLNAIVEKLEMASSVVKEPPKKEVKVASNQKQKAKAQVIAKAAASKDDSIREKWLSMGIEPLNTEISKSNMNVIRRIVKPWKLKPKGRKKQDLVNATLDFIKQ